VADSVSLPLSDALIEWSDPAQVEAVRKAEQNSVHHEVCGFYQEHPTRIQLSTDAELVSYLEGFSLDPTGGATIASAWNRLERSFRKQVVDGRVFLQGIAIGADSAPTPEPIPGAWATHCSFDFNRDQVTAGERVYGAVMVSRTPPVPAVINSAPHSMTPEPITAESVRDLTVDEMLLLLEEYHQRVIISAS
jgi:hypothetical protein